MDRGKEDNEMDVWGDEGEWHDAAVGTDNSGLQ